MASSSGIQRNSFTTMPVLLGYLPVNRLLRYGPHTGYPDTAFVKSTDSDANWSMFGVAPTGDPTYPEASRRSWSASTKSRFGRGMRGAAVGRYGASARVT